MVRRTDLVRDSFYKRAKKEGYRSRAAFKLIQIDDRFKIMNDGDVVIDLGAAPGGWSQVARKRVGQKGIVIAVDIENMDIAGIEIKTIKCDITSEEETINAIKEVLMVILKDRDRELDYVDVDIVLSDAAPKLSGNKSYDHFRSFELCIASLNISSALLKEGGNFVAKIFQGENYPGVYREMKKRFGYVRAYSPQASRKSSAEIYVIGKSFKKSFT
jgi:23S rRNA (uridine2552-2'-O)-methyltransferase